MHKIIGPKLFGIHLPTLYPRAPFGRKLLFTITILLYSSVWLHVRMHKYDLSRGQGPGGLIQRLKLCGEGNEDLKDTLQLRLQITAFSRWATGLQSSLFHWSEQLSVCIKYSKNGRCILARWLLQSSFLALICAFSSVFFFHLFGLFRQQHQLRSHITYRITMTETF